MSVTDTVPVTGREWGAFRTVQQPSLPDAGPTPLTTFPDEQTAQAWIAQQIATVLADTSGTVTPVEASLTHLIYITSSPERGTFTDRIEVVPLARQPSLETTEPDT